jgi:hypothetical protein
MELHVFNDPQNTYHRALYFSYDTTNKKVSLRHFIKAEDMFPGGVPSELPANVVSISHNEQQYCSCWSVNEIPLQTFWQEFEATLPDHQVYAFGVADYNFANPRWSRIVTIPLFRFSVNSKLPIQYISSIPMLVQYFMVIPFSESTLDEYVHVVYANDLILSGDSVTVTNHEGDVYAAYAFALSRLPKITCTKSGIITNTNTVQVTATVKQFDDTPAPHDITLFLEGVNCQPSKQRIRTTNRQATFTVSAPAYESGDDCRVKIGAKYFSSICEVDLTQ